MCPLLPFVPPFVSFPAKRKPFFPTAHCRRSTGWRASLAPLEEAIRRDSICDVGRIVRLGKDARLNTETLGLWKPPSVEWGDAVEATLKLVCEFLGDRLASVYVRGSVAAGHAFNDGRSDLDLVVLVWNETIWEDYELRTHIYSISTAIRRQFPFVCSVDITVFRLSTSAEDGSYTCIGKLEEATRFLILAYCVHIYGIDFRPYLGRPAPPRHSLRDVRERERRALGASTTAVSNSAATWFIKSTLRGLIDLTALHTSLHTRDIVPCARILGKEFPSQATLIANSVLLACTSGDDVDDKEEIIHDLADFAEREYLDTIFGDVSNTPTPSISQLPAAVSWTPVFTIKKKFENVVHSLRAVSRILQGTPLPPAPQPARLFLRDNLPTIALKVSRTVDTELVGKESRKPYVGEQYLRDYVSPQLFRNVLSTTTTTSDISKLALQSLAQPTILTSVRITSGNVFTFCRAKHNWISDGTFSAPSVLVQMSTKEFLSRIHRDPDARPPPLRYKNERVYMQSAVVLQKERLYRIAKEIGIVQGERRWVSTHGSVSSLHYDTAYSVLLQISGCKRLLFFPPSALPTLRIYPYGHPLHRRASVDLGRPGAMMFGEFWNEFADKAIEACLAPGDLVVFPPLWSHYTESMAGEGELCTSHTLRYVSKV